MMNPHRGELEAEIAGETRCLRLTFDALAAIEAALDTGIIDVAERFPARRVGTRDVFVILKEALTGGGDALDDGQLSDAIMEMGFVAAARLAGRVLATGLGTGDDEEAAPLAPAPPETTAGRGTFRGGA